MGAHRSPAVKKKAYIEIDLDLLQRTGEIKIIGEPILAPEVTLAVPRGSFEITYTAELFGLLKRMGNKKIEVLAYLLDHKDGNNAINTSLREVSKKTGISTETVRQTFSILADSGLLTRKGSVYMISPHLMIKGSQAREAWLMRKYVEMDANEDDCDCKLFESLNDEIKKAAI